MYGIIASKKHFEAIIEAITPPQIVYHKAGSFTGEQFIQHCKAAANVTLQTLIIDISCTSNEEAICRGIRQYRSMRTTRIIIIAPDREPGDPTLSFIIGLGIWDILTPKTNDDEESDESNHKNIYDLAAEIHYQIRKIPTYGDVARYHTSSIEIPHNHAPKEKAYQRKSIATFTQTISDQDPLEFLEQYEIPRVKEKIIKVPEIINLKQKVITLINYHPRAGSRFIATNLAKILENYKFTAGVLELDLTKPKLHEIVEPTYKKSWHNEIKDTGYIGHRIESEKAIFLHAHKMSDWTKEDTVRLLLFAKQIPILFVVIGNERRSEIVEEVIKASTEVWFVLEDSAVQYNVYLPENKDLLTRIANKTIIGNKWTDVAKEFQEALQQLNLIANDCEEKKESNPVVTIPDYGSITKKAEYDRTLLYEYKEYQSRIESDFLPLLHKVVPNFQKYMPKKKRRFSIFQ